MEPLKINLWLVAQIIALVMAFVCFFTTVAFRQLTLQTAGLYCLGIVIICSLESEQKNAD